MRDEWEDEISLTATDRLYQKRSNPMAISLFCLSLMLTGGSAEQQETKGREYLKETFLELIVEIPFHGEFPIRDDILDIVATAAPAIFLLKDEDIQYFVERKHLDRDSFLYRMRATLAILLERREFQRRVISKLDEIKSNEIKRFVTELISEARSPRRCPGHRMGEQTNGQ